MTRREKFSAKRRIWRKDPVLFAQEVCNFQPDEWQRQVLRDLAEYPRISVRSGQGVGKTSIEAVALLWFLACFKYARVVATAPTLQQLRDVLWAEVSKWQSKSPLLKRILKWTKTRLSVVGEEERWFAVARTATKPENMQGFHEDYMLFLVDEASGVADAIMEAIQGTLSGPNNKLAMFGNPTKTSGTFYNSFHADCTRYRCHKVSSLDSPRTNKENIDFLIAKYGEESNVVRVRVYGEFPIADEDAFITLTMAEMAMHTEIDFSGSITFGVDVARYGDDKTVIAMREGNALTIPVVRHGQNLMQTVGDIVKLYRETMAARPEYRGRITVNIDDTGLGGGVTDRLDEVRVEEKLGRMDIIPINFGGSIPNKNAAENYANMGTWLWAKMRDDIMEGALAFPNDTELVAQLSTRKYSLNSRGKIILEDKKTMKKRGLPSPDRADAVGLACYVDTTKRAQQLGNASSSLIKESQWR
ncbi:MAG: terminase B [Defluviitaleaceae bacterium]|nr:terminase B [Defluviitaleaceae bacterium]